MAARPRRHLTASHLNYEEYRRRTFKSWPSAAPVRSDTLSKAGFYYLGNGQEVVCYSCGGKISNWNGGDTGIIKHSEAFPECHVVLGNSNNVPVDEEEDEGIHTDEEGTSWVEQDVEVGNLRSEWCKVKFMPNSVPERQHGRELSRQPLSPNFAFYTLKSARLRSFCTWPKRSPVKPDSLAEAGFFYSGFRDNVQCFYCNGTLNNWAPGDDPWVEHLRWFPTCLFCLLHKGEPLETMPATSLASSPPLPAPFSAPSFVPFSPPPPLIRPESSTVEIPISLSLPRLSQLPTPGSRLDLRVKEEITSNPIIQVALHTMDVFTRGDYYMAIQHQIQTTGSSSISNMDDLMDAVCRWHLSTGETGPSPPDLVAEQSTAGDEKNVCKICLDREVKIVFLPCGHLIACQSCALFLTSCAICRSPIRETVRVFLS